MRNKVFLCVMAGAAVTLVTTGAGAHELQCRKTVEGQAAVVVDQYPTTLHYQVTVTNVHPSDESVVLTASDSLQSLNFNLSLTLGVGESASDSYTLTISSFAECARLTGGTDDVVGSVVLENVFSIGWDLGSAQCMAEVTCRPPGEEMPPPTGATRTMGFFKTHETALQSCLDQGAIDLGFITVSTLENALGLLWGSPREFADGSVRAGLDKFRFLLARQTLVAICNVRLFGTDDGGLTAAAVAALGGNDCMLLSSLESQVDDFNNSGDSVGFPPGFTPGPATPKHAAGIATDPTSPSGGSCQ